MNAEPEREADAQLAEDRRETIAVPVLITDLASKTLAIKEGETFLYSDLEGNLDHAGDYGLGLYHKDTRFLSHFRMEVSGRNPVLLSSSSERGYMSYVDLTNPDLYDGDVVAVDQQTLNVRRIRAINGKLFERVRIKNYNPHPIALELGFSLAADFADIFEVRGMAREKNIPPDRPIADQTDRTHRRAARGPGTLRGARIRRGRPRAPPVLRGVGAGLHADPHRQRVVQPAPEPEPAGPSGAVHRDRWRRHPGRGDPLVRNDLRTRCADLLAPTPLGEPRAGPEGPRAPGRPPGHRGR